MKKGKATKKLILSYAILILWALLIFKLSSEGHDASSGRSDAIVTYIQHAGSTLPSDVLSFLTRKAAHTVAYFIFGILAYNVVRQYKRTTRRTIIISILIVLGYALSDEFHQAFVPGRTAMLTDVLIDTTAGTIGVTLAYLTHKKIINRKVASTSGKKLQNKV
ncbi:MAG: VanZ family protein [Candidatus Saccharimonadaceae bacterium]